MSKPALHDLPARYQAQAVAQLHAVPRPKTLNQSLIAAEPQKKRLRQNSSGLNKTEAAFFAHLKAMMPEHSHHAQALTLRIGNGVRYTPDFASFATTGEIVAHEVKGFMRDDAAVKLKVAASLYPQIRFRLVSKAKGGTWEMQEILP